MKNIPYSQLTAFSLFFLVSRLCFASLPAPSLNTPYSNATVKTFEAKLFVSPVSGATGYQFQYDTLNSFNSPIVQKDTTSTTSFVTQTLQPGKKYYWRARAFKPGDTSSWSGWSNFNLFTQLELVSPNTAATGAIKNLTCATASFIPEVTYIFDVDTVSTFSSGARVIISQNTPGAADTSLFHYGSKLYWRATAVSAIGDTLLWSVMRSYTFYTRPVFNGIPPFGPTIRLTWPSMELADVSLQMDTVNTFNSDFLIEKTFPPGTLTDSIATLYFGQSYFFRIRGRYGNSVSDWSQTQSTKIASKAIFNVNATDSATRFSWQNLTGAGLQLQFANDSLFSQMRVDTFFVAQQNMYLYPGFLGFSKSYFCRVRYFHVLDTGAWEVYPYTTTDGNFMLQTPINHTLNIDVRTHFTFMMPAWTNKVVMEIDTGYSFSGSHSSYYIRIDSFSYDNFLTYFADTSLHYNQRYVWRVYGIREADTGNIATEYTFVTKSMPSLVTPQANIVGVGVNPDFLVVGVKGSSFVQWQLDTTSSFNSPQFATGRDPNSPDVLYPQNVRLTLPKDQFFNQNYYWRVRCINPVDTTAWTLISRYTTTTPIKMISPKNNETDVALPPVLVWNIEGFIPDYWFQYRYGTDSILDNTPFKTIVTGGPISVPVDCDYDTSYFWQVRALHSRDTTDWTPVSKFTTIVNTGLIEQDGMLTIQLYPNPAKDKLVIAAEQPFSVSIYNSKGILVFRNDRELSLLTIHTADWYPGLYIAKIVSGEGSIVKRIIISR